MKKLILLIAFFNAWLVLAQPFSNVAVLNGTNDFIEAPNSFGSNFNNAISIEAWINPCDVSGYKVIGSKWYCSGDDNAFFFSIFNGKLRWTWDTDLCSNGSNTYQSNSAIIQTNQWQHVAVAHDSNGVSLYLNGVIVAANLTAGSAYSTIQTSAQKFRIGAYRIGSTSYVGFYKGLIDEVRIWKTKRTGTEISANYLTSLTGSQTDLEGYYKMNITNSGSGVTVPNSATATGTAVDGTTVGSAISPAFNNQNFAVISSVLGADTLVCGSTISLLLDATTPGATYLWNNGSTTATKTVTLAGQYSVKIKIGCNEYFDTIQVTFQPVPAVNLGNDSTLCSGQSILLDASSTGASYLWADGSTTALKTVNTAGTYSVTVSKNGCSSTDGIVIDYVSLASLNLGSDTSICNGNSIILDATDTLSSYLWSDGTTGPTLTVNQTGTYSVEVNHFCGIVKDTVNIVVIPLPSVYLGNDTTLCTGQSVLLDASLSGATYLWHDGTTGPTYTIDAYGLYSVAVSKNGCSKTDQLVASYLSLPMVDLGPDIITCQGNAITLDATNTSVSYLWSTGATTATLPVNSTGTYYVDVSHYCGIVQDTINVTVHPLPIVDLGNDTTLCTGQTQTLDATLPGATYLWQDGSTNGQFLASLAGAYTVTVTKNGCSTTDDIIVSYISPASVDLGADQNLCQGNAITLDATNTAVSYLWSTGATTATLPVNTTGTYWVDVSHYCGIVQDTINVTVHPLPIVDLGNDTTLCTGQTHTLDATLTGATYLWQDGSTNGQFSASVAGTYTVTVTKNGCSTTDDIIVSYISPASVDLGADQNLCQGNAITLDATNTAVSYLWSTGATTATLPVNTTGTYWVDVSHYCGIVQDTINVTVHPLPIVDLGNDTTLCTGQTHTLDATLTGATYLWQDGSTNGQFSASLAGTYTVTVTKNGCSTTDAIDVIYSSIQVDLGPDLSLCEGENSVLNVQQVNATYLWQDGSTNSNYIISESGTYFVTLAESACTVSDTLIVDYESLDKNISYSIISECGYANIELSALPVSSNGSTFNDLHWKVGNNDEFIGNNGSVYITESGSYNIEVSTTMGNCVIDTSFSVQANIYEIPQVDFTVSNVQPDIDEIIYFTNRTIGATTYTWKFGNGDESNDEDPNYSYNTGSRFNVVLEAANNHCTANASTIIEVKEPLIFYIPNAFTPNGTQLNEVFKPVFTSGFDPYNYQLRIFNRWGEILFISHDPNIGWDGMYAGNDLRSGVFVWEVSFGQIDRSGRIVENGTVTLLK